MTQIINARWQMRYGTAAQWVASNEVLLADEMGHETDTGRAKIGNGTDGWSARPYAILGAIDFTGLADKYIMSWDATAGKWKAGPSVGGDAFAVASGTDTITATFTVAPDLADGLQFKVRAAGANTTTAPTFNPNSLGALTITKLGGVALAVGDISGAGHELIIRYRASPARYELVNPAGVQQPVPGFGMAVDLTNPRKPVFSSTLGSISVTNDVADYSSLPTLTGGDAGQYWVTRDTGMAYRWSGSAWPAFGAGINLSVSNRATTLVSTPASTTNTTMAYGTAVPTKTQGDAITGLAVTITPLKSSSQIRVRVYLPVVSGSGSTMGFRFAICRDSATNAVGAAYCIANGANNSQVMVVETYVPPNAAVATTFNVRW